MNLDDSNHFMAIIAFTFGFITVYTRRILKKSLDIKFL